MSKSVAPIVVFRDFIPDPQVLFDHLWATVPWERIDMVPRYEYWMNDFQSPYTYGRGEFARTYVGHDWIPEVAAIRDRLSPLIGARLDSCFLNGYKDERDHLGYHSDDSPEMDSARPIVVVSIGAERQIWFRSKSDRTNQEKVSLPPGSLLVMTAGMQQTHDHRIPKNSSKCGPRLSMTFRGLIPV